MWNRNDDEKTNRPVFHAFDEQKLYITQPDAADGEHNVIDLRRLAEPHAFVKAVFEAAISQCPTPPLPDDTLLG